MIMSVFIFNTCYSLQSLCLPDWRQMLYNYNSLCYFLVIFKFLSLLCIYQVLTNQRVSFRSNDHYIDLFTRKESYTQLAGEQLEKPFIFSFLPSFYMSFVCFFSLFIFMIYYYVVRKCTIYDLWTNTSKTSQLYF